MELEVDKNYTLCKKKDKCKKDSSAIKCWLKCSDYESEPLPIPSELEGTFWKNPTREE